MSDLGIKLSSPVIQEPRADFPEAPASAQAPESGSFVSVTPTVLYFGKVKKGTSATRYFVLQNSGDKEVQVNLLAPIGFVLDRQSVLLPPQGSVYVHITFTPLETRTYQGHVSMTPGASSVLLSGEGVN